MGQLLPEELIKNNFDFNGFDYFESIRYSNLQFLKHLQFLSTGFGIMAPLKVKTDLRKYLKFGKIILKNQWYL